MNASHYTIHINCSKYDQVSISSGRLAITQLNIHVKTSIFKFTWEGLRSKSSKIFAVEMTDDQRILSFTQTKRINMGFLLNLVKTQGRQREIAEKFWIRNSCFEISAILGNFNHMQVNWKRSKKIMISGVKLLMAVNFIIMEEESKSS